jgi:hypothetical protein
MSILHVKKMTNDEGVIRRSENCLRARDFSIRISFVIRQSCFVIRFMQKAISAVAATTSSPAPSATRPPRDRDRAER